MSMTAVRYGFYVDDGVTGEIGAETTPGGQRLADDQKVLLERIQQLVAQAQSALTNGGGSMDALASGAKLVNAVNALKNSLANFQTAIRAGDATRQKSTAESVLGAATEFQKTLEGLKSANPNAAIPTHLKALGAGLAGLKDMLSQKAQVGKITRHAVLRGGVTDLAAARILNAIKAIISDKTHPQAVREALAAVSKALDARKAAGQPLSVKDIVSMLAGKGQDAVNAVVVILAAAKQPAATQAVVAALANIPEKGPQMAALATVAVAQVNQQIAVQAITHVATVNPQAAAHIMTVVAAAQPSIIQSVAQTAIHSEKPTIVAMALAALTEVKQQQPAAIQAMQNIAAALADKGQPAINAVAIALAELKQPAATQALQTVITTLSETKPQMVAQAIAELAKTNPQIAAKVITQLAEANPQTATQIMTTVAAVQPNVIQAIAQQAVRGELSPVAAAAQAALAEVKQQQSGRADLGKGDLGPTQPSGGGISLADIKAAGTAMATEALSQQRTSNFTAVNGSASAAGDKVTPSTTGMAPANFEAPKEPVGRPVGESVITPPPPPNPENKINPAPPQNPPPAPHDGPPASPTEPQPITPNPPREGQAPNPTSPLSDASPPPPPTPQPVTPPPPPPTNGPAETPANPPPSQTPPLTPVPERIPDPIVTGPDSRPTVYVAEGPPVVINGESYQTMTRTVWCPDCGPKGGPVVEVVTAAEQAVMKGATAEGIDPKLEALYKQQNIEKEFKASGEEHVHGPGCGHDFSAPKAGDAPVNQTPVRHIEISTPNSVSEPGEIQFSVNRFNASSEAANNAGSSPRQRRQANIKAPAPDPS